MGRGPEVAISVRLVRWNRIHTDIDQVKASVPFSVADDLLFPGCRQTSTRFGCDNRRSTADQSTQHRAPRHPLRDLARQFVEPFSIHGDSSPSSRVHPNWIVLPKHSGEMGAAEDPDEYGLVERAVWLEFEVRPAGVVQ